MPSWKKYGKYYIDQEGVKKYSPKKNNPSFQNMGPITDFDGENRVYSRNWLAEIPEDGIARLEGGATISQSEIVGIFGAGDDL